MNKDFERLTKEWEDMGLYDPLWAVVSHPEKRDNQWNLNDFIQTGKITVQRYCDLINRYVHRQPPFDRVLDFGCGVGRLSRAWSACAYHVVGIDISSSMIAKAWEINTEISNLEFIINQAQDLRVFGDGSFDLVMSHICLQHMPWRLQELYISEFARVCRRLGIVTFQLPASGKKMFLKQIRKYVVDMLPMGLGKKYRKWRHGNPSVMDMFFTSPEQVELLAKQLGLELLHKEEDMSGGPDTHGYIYLFRKL